MLSSSIFSKVKGIEKVIQDVKDFTGGSSHQRKPITPVVPSEDQPESECENEENSKIDIQDSSEDIIHTGGRNKLKTMVRPIESVTSGSSTIESMPSPTSPRHRLDIQKGGELQRILQELENQPSTDLASSSIATDLASSCSGVESYGIERTYSASRSQLGDEQEQPSNDEASLEESGTQSKEQPGETFVASHSSDDIVIDPPHCSQAENVEQVEGGVQKILNQVTDVIDRTTSPEHKSSDSIVSFVGLQRILNSNSEYDIEGGMVQNILKEMNEIIGGGGTTTPPPMMPQEQRQKTDSPHTSLFESFRLDSPHPRSEKEIEDGVNRILNQVKGVIASSTGLDTKSDLSASLVPGLHKLLLSTSENDTEEGVQGVLKQDNEGVENDSISEHERLNSSTSFPSLQGMLKEGEACDLASNDQVEHILDSRESLPNCCDESSATSTKSEYDEVERSIRVERILRDSSKSEHDEVERSIRVERILRETTDSESEHSRKSKDFQSKQDGDISSPKLSSVSDYEHHHKSSSPRSRSELMDVEQKSQQEATGYQSENESAISSFSSSSDPETDTTDSEGSSYVTSHSERESERHRQKKKSPRAAVAIPSFWPNVFEPEPENSVFRSPSASFASSCTSSSTLFSSSRSDSYSEGIADWQHDDVERGSDLVDTCRNDSDLVGTCRSCNRRKRLAESKHLESLPRKHQSKYIWQETESSVHSSVRKSFTSSSSHSAYRYGKRSGFEAFTRREKSRRDHDLQNSYNPASFRGKDDDDRILYDRSEAILSQERYDGDVDTVNKDGGDAFDSNRDTLSERDLIIGNRSRTFSGQGGSCILGNRSHCTGAESTQSQFDMIDCEDESGIRSRTFSGQGGSCIIGNRSHCTGATSTQCQFDMTGCEDESVDVTSMLGPSDRYAAVSQSTSSKFDCDELEAPAIFDRYDPISHCHSGDEDGSTLDKYSELLSRENSVEDSMPDKLNRHDAEPETEVCYVKLVTSRWNNASQTTVCEIRKEYECTGRIPENRSAQAKFVNTGWEDVIQVLRSERGSLLPIDQHMESCSSHSRTTASSVRDGSTTASVFSSQEVKKEIACSSHSRTLNSSLRNETGVDSGRRPREVTMEIACSSHSRTRPNSLRDETAVEDGAGPPKDRQDIVPREAKKVLLPQEVKKGSTAQEIRADHGRATPAVEGCTASLISDWSNITSTFRSARIEPGTGSEETARAEPTRTDDTSRDATPSGPTLDAESCTESSGPNSLSTISLPLEMAQKNNGDESQASTLVPNTEVCNNNDGKCKVKLEEPPTERNDQEIMLDNDEIKDIFGDRGTTKAVSNDTDCINEDRRASEMVLNNSTDGIDVESMGTKLCNKTEVGMSVKYQSHDGNTVEAVLVESNPGLGNPQDQSQFCSQDQSDVDEEDSFDNMIPAPPESFELNSNNIVLVPLNDGQKFNTCIAQQQAIVNEVGIHETQKTAAVVTYTATKETNKDLSEDGMATPKITDGEGNFGDRAIELRKKAQSLSLFDQQEGTTSCKEVNVEETKICNITENINADVNQDSAINITTSSRHKEQPICQPSGNDAVKDNQTPVPKSRAQRSAFFYQKQVADKLRIQRNANGFIYNAAKMRQTSDIATKPTQTEQSDGESNKALDVDKKSCEEKARKECQETISATSAAASETKQANPNIQNTHVKFSRRHEKLKAIARRRRISSNRIANNEKQKASAGKEPDGNDSFLLPSEKRSFFPSSRKSTNYEKTRKQKLDPGCAKQEQGSDWSDKHLHAWDDDLLSNTFLGTNASSGFSASSESYLEGAVKKSVANCSANRFKKEERADKSNKGPVKSKSCSSDIVGNKVGNKESCFDDAVKQKSIDCSVDKPEEAHVKRSSNSISKQMSPIDNDREGSNHHRDKEMKKYVDYLFADTPENSFSAALSESLSFKSANNIFDERNTVSDKHLEEHLGRFLSNLSDGLSAGAGVREQESMRNPRCFNSRPDP